MGAGSVDGENVASRRTASGEVEPATAEAARMRSTLGATTPSAVYLRRRTSSATSSADESSSAAGGATISSMSGDQCSIYCASVGAGGAARGGVSFMKTSAAEETRVLPPEAQEYLRLQDAHAGGENIKNPEVADPLPALPVTEAPTQGYTTAYGTTVATDHTQIESVERVCHDGAFYTLYDLEELRQSRASTITDSPTTFDATRVNLFPTCASSAVAEVEEIKVVKCELAFSLSDAFFASLGPAFVSGSSEEAAPLTGASTGGDGVEEGAALPSAATRAPKVIPGGSPEQTLPPPPVVTEETIAERITAPRTVTQAEKQKAAQVTSNIDSIAIVLRNSLISTVSPDDTLLINSFTMNGDITVNVAYYGRRRRRRLGGALEVDSRSAEAAEEPTSTRAAVDPKERDQNAAQEVGERTPTYDLDDDVDDVFLLTTSSSREIKQADQLQWQRELTTGSSSTTSLKFDFEVKFKGTDAATKADAVSSAISAAPSSGPGAPSSGNTTSAFEDAFTASFSTVFGVSQSAIGGISTSATAATVFVEKNRWEYDPWGSCTNTCGSGTQSRTYFCYIASGAFDANCPAGVSHVTEQPCEDWTGCPFLITCPVGQRYGCGWQTAMVLGVTGFLLLSLAVYLYRGCRRPRGGKTSLKLEGVKQTSVAWRKAWDEEKGKTKIVWDLIPDFQPGLVVDGRAVLDTKEVELDVFKTLTVENEKREAPPLLLVNSMSAEDKKPGDADQAEKTKEGTIGQEGEDAPDMQQLSAGAKNLLLTAADEETAGAAFVRRAASKENLPPAARALEDSTFLPHCFHLHARVDYWSESGQVYLPAMVESFDAKMQTLNLSLRGNMKRQHVSFHNVAVPLSPGEPVEFTCGPSSGAGASAGLALLPSSVSSARKSKRVTQGGGSPWGKDIDADATPSTPTLKRARTTAISARSSEAAIFPDEEDEENRRMLYGRWFGPCHVVKTLGGSRGYVLELRRELGVAAAANGSRSATTRPEIEVEAGGAVAARRSTETSNKSSNLDLGTRASSCRRFVVSERLNVRRFFAPSDEVLVFRNQTWLRGVVVEAKTSTKVQEDAATRAATVAQDRKQTESETLTTPAEAVRMLKLKDEGDDDAGNDAPRDHLEVMRKAIDELDARFDFLSRSPRKSGPRKSTTQRLADSSQEAFATPFTARVVATPSPSRVSRSAHQSTSPALGHQRGPVLARAATSGAILTASPPPTTPARASRFDAAEETNRWEQAQGSCFNHRLILVRWPKQENLGAVDLDHRKGAALGELKNRSLDGENQEQDWVNLDLEPVLPVALARPADAEQFGIVVQASSSPSPGPLVLPQAEKEKE
ncbi:unnamed protein product [Amoebophrya sp. A120]|nr:unnamed protein product [Amoebophrya sp. A120]|eukprot:GSA120T00015037001.1